MQTGATILVNSEIASYIRSRWAKFACDVLDPVPMARNQPGGLMMSKKLITQNEAERWNRIIQTMCIDGTLHKITRQYFKASKLNPVICNMSMKQK